MDETVRAVVAAIHDAPALLVYEFTGAGSLALHWLHAVPGSSRTVLEATDRYAAASLVGLLGSEPERFVSPETATAMAAAARRRALELAPDGATVLGVGCTTTIATDRTKRGEHRVSVAVAAHDGTAVADLVLEKGKRDRAGEEELVARVVIAAIATACGLDAAGLERY